MVSIMKTRNRKKKLNIKPSSVKVHLTRIHDNAISHSSNSKCTPDLGLSNKNLTKSQEISLPNDYWKDSFDKLLDDRSQLRKNNIIKKNVNASYNKESFDEFSFKINKNKLKRKQIKKLPNNNNNDNVKKNYLKSPFVKIKNTFVSTPILKNKSKNVNKDLSISISPINKKKYGLRRFFKKDSLEINKNKELFEFSKNSIPSFSIEFCSSDNNNENRLQINGNYNKNDKYMNKKKGRKKINKMNGNLVENSKLVERINLNKLQNDDDFKENQNKKREILKLKKIKPNKNENKNLRSKNGNGNVEKLDMYRSLITKVVLQKTIPPFRYSVRNDETDIATTSIDKHLINPNSLNLNKTQRSLKKTSELLHEKLPSSQEFEIPSICLSSTKNQILDSSQLNLSNALNVNSNNSKILNRTRNQMLSVVLIENSREINNSKSFINRQSSERRRETMVNTIENYKIKLKKKNNILYSKELIRKRKPVVKLKKLKNLNSKAIHSNLPKSLNVQDKENKRISEKETLNRNQTSTSSKNKRKSRTTGPLLHLNSSRSIPNENVPKSCIKCNQCVHKLFNSFEHQSSSKDITFVENVLQWHKNLSLLRDTSNTSNVANNAGNSNAVKDLSAYYLSSSNLYSNVVINTELNKIQENSREIENRNNILNDITTKFCNSNDDLHERTKDKVRKNKENNKLRNNKNKCNYITTRRQKNAISVVQESRGSSRRLSIEISNSSINHISKQKNHSSINCTMNSSKLLLINNTLSKNDNFIVNSTTSQNNPILDNITKRNKNTKIVKVNEEGNVQIQNNDFYSTSALSYSINSISEESLEILMSHQKDVVKNKKSMNIILPSGKWRKSINVWKRHQLIDENNEISIQNQSTSPTTNNSQNKINNSYNNIDEQKSKFCRRKITINNLDTVQDVLENENLNQNEEVLINSKTNLGVAIKPINDAIEENRRSRVSRKQSSVALSNNQQSLHDRLSKIRLTKNIFELSHKSSTSPNRIRKRNSNIQNMVFQLCEQTKPIEFKKEYSKSILKNCRKIGEGVYGEVFMNIQKIQYNEEISNVLKIIPIEGNIIVNGEKQKKFDEVFSELIIATELSRLKCDKDFMTPCFVDVRKIRCVEGKYPQHLIKLWEHYDEQKNSENDHPEIFPDDQLYIVLELANGGQDLEAFVFDNALQSYSAFLQIAFSIAIAENKLKFEHRDLHWGNILLTKTEEKNIIFHFNGKEFKVPTHGIKVTIIDYTLSRMIFDDFCFFNDLSNDEELFSATGDYQFDIYRLMKKALSNNWERFEPYTNILWLHYVIDKMINGVRYRNSKTKKHRSYIDIMMQLRDKLLNYKSTCSYINQNFN